MVSCCDHMLSRAIKTRSKTNLVASRRLLELLEGAVKRYQNNLLTTTEIIQELISLATAVKEADARGESLGLSVAEVAFYDALEVCIRNPLEIKSRFIRNGRQVSQEF